MNTVIRIALGITTITCAFCVYLINDYRGRLKTAELIAFSIEENATKTAAQSSGLEADNQELNKNIELFQREIASLMRQLENAATRFKTAHGASQEKEKQLLEGAQNLSLVKFERDKLKEAAKKTQQLEKALATYQSLGTVAQLQRLKDQLNKIQTTPGAAVPNPLSAAGEGRAKVKPGTELGLILSVDSKLGFCVINCGSAKGIMKGDEFHVHRGGDFVGKIKIDEVRSAVAIATAVKKFTPKELRAGDKVIQGK